MSSLPHSYCLIKRLLCIVKCRWFLTNTFLLFVPDAFDPLDPNGNITIKWDVISWTPDGYVVSNNNLDHLLII